MKVHDFLYQVEIMETEYKANIFYNFKFNNYNIENGDTTINEIKSS